MASNQVDRIGNAGQAAAGLNLADVFLKSTLTEPGSDQCKTLGLRNRGVFDPLTLDALPFLDTRQLGFDIGALSTFDNLKRLCVDADRLAN